MAEMGHRSHFVMYCFPLRQLPKSGLIWAYKNCHNFLDVCHIREIFVSLERSLQDLSKDTTHISIP